MGHRNLYHSFLRTLPHCTPPHGQYIQEERCPFSFTTCDSTLLGRKNPLQPSRNFPSSIPPLVPLLVLSHAENLVRNSNRSFDLFPYPPTIRRSLRTFDSLFFISRNRRRSDLYRSTRRILARRTRRFRSFVHDDPLLHVPLRTRSPAPSFPLTEIFHLDFEPNSTEKITFGSSSDCVVIDWNHGIMLVDVVDD